MWPRYVHSLAAPTLSVLLKHNNFYALRLSRLIAAIVFHVPCEEWQCERTQVCKPGSVIIDKPRNAAVDVPAVRKQMGAETVSVLGKDTKGKTNKRISNLQHSQTSWTHQAGTQRRALEWLRVCYPVSCPPWAKGEGQSLRLRKGEKRGISSGRKNHKKPRDDSNSNLLGWLMPFKAFPGSIVSVAGQRHVCIRWMELTRCLWAGWRGCSKQGSTMTLAWSWKRE